MVIYIPHNFDLTEYNVVVVFVVVVVVVVVVVSDMLLVFSF